MIKKEILSVSLILFISLFCISLAYAWEDCNKGFTDENCPVDCGDYTDTNKDRICDHSQENPTLISNLNTDTNLNTQSNNQTTGEINNSITKSRYNLIPIFLITLILYLITYFLSKKEKISVVNHKKIWNILLLATFLITAVTSLLYILRVDYSFDSINLSKISFLHIEIGIVMITISIFHTIWHWPYFKSYLKTKSKE